LKQISCNEQALETFFNAQQQPYEPLPEAKSHPIDAIAKSLNIFYETMVIENDTT
jgi:hypothetical protein